MILAQDAQDATRYREHFIRVGVDALTGFTTSLEGLLGDGVQVVTMDELAKDEHAFLLDVRSNTEYAEGYIPGAERVPVSRVIWDLSELPSDATIVTYCASGRRAAVGASALRRYGYDVAELDGSYNSWIAQPGNVPARPSA